MTADPRARTGRQNHEVHQAVMLVTHRRPIQPDCPVDCLQAVLSRKSLNPLIRADSALFDPPRTVGDVLRLCQQHKLGQIRGLGRRRISEIEAAIVLAGLDITAHDHD